MSLANRWGAVLLGWQDLQWIGRRLACHTHSHLYKSSRGHPAPFPSRGRHPQERPSKTAELLLLHACILKAARFKRKCLEEAAGQSCGGRTGQAACQELSAPDGE